VKPRLGSVSVNRDPKKDGLDDLFRVMIQVTFLLIHERIVTITINVTINSLFITILLWKCLKFLSAGFMAEW